MSVTEQLIWEDLNRFSDAHATCNIAIGVATVVRYDDIGQEWCLMSRPDRGFGEYSYSYKSLWALFSIWRIKIAGSGEDKHSKFLRVEPLPRKE